jgi:hypothetical protein
LFNYDISFKVPSSVRRACERRTGGDGIIIDFGELRGTSISLEGLRKKQENSGVTGLISSYDNPLIKNRITKQSTVI